VQLTSQVKRDMLWKRQTFTAVFSVSHCAHTAIQGVSERTAALFFRIEVTLNLRDFDNG